MRAKLVLAVLTVAVGSTGCSNGSAVMNSSAGTGGTHAGAGATASGARAAATGNLSGATGKTAGAGGTTTGAIGSPGGAAGKAAGAGGDPAGASGKPSGAGGTLGGSGGQATSSIGGAANNNQKWVGGYYPGYQLDDYPPEEIDFTAVTHLFIGAGLPQTDGSLDMSLYLDNTRGPALAKRLVGLAHGSQRKAILMLGGAGADAGFIAAASERNRTAFVQSLLAAVDEYGFDGLDLDWEPMGSADQAPLRALAQALRTARPTLLITIPVGYVNANAPEVDPFWGEIAPLVDQINLMTYAMTGAWDGWQSWHSSALSGAGASTPSSVQSSVDAYLKAGVSAAKLGIGIGFYGVCYTAPVTGPNQNLGGASVVTDDNTLSYAGIISKYFSPEARRYDSNAAAPYLSFATPRGSENCSFISYEDAESIAAKGDYVREKGLGGAIIWTINEGHIVSAPAGQRDPLLAAVRDAFLR